MKFASLLGKTGSSKVEPDDRTRREGLVRVRTATASVIWGCGITLLSIRSNGEEQKRFIVVETDDGKTRKTLSGTITSESALTDLKEVVKRILDSLS